MGLGPRGPGPLSTRGPLRAIAALAAVPVVALVALVGLAWVNGWTLHSVESTSMAPAVNRGDLAVVVPVRPAEIRRASVVVYPDRRHPGRRIAHRVIEVVEQHGRPLLRTKGDANAGPDPEPVAAGDVVGEVRWAIPVIGGVVAAIDVARPLVLAVSLAVAIAALARRRRRTVPGHKAGREGRSFRLSTSPLGCRSIPPQRGRNRHDRQP